MSLTSPRKVAGRGARRGIFCLEGDWWSDLGRSSTVKPVLKLLSQGAGYSVPYIHRDVGTVEELRYYLSKWRQMGMARYPVLYLALHGLEGTICVGDQRRREAHVSLDRLAEWLGPSLKGRIIHFASCETLKTDRRNLRRFVAATQATAVTGYGASIDWLRSAAFEVLLFEVMLRKPTTAAYARAIRAEVRREFKHLAREHDFRVFVNGE